ncbi:L-threonylcarbamoyladenylate synthase [Thioclava kandeliae]|uniref:Threonylcarbamoyl-AMP synthase n=1 Tax=Thioclava kandeliae TaxID=3070818 RepID=A0ABV1SCX6_9RHOB
MTDLLSATPEGYTEAARLLGRGELVAFATETVYGLGGDARNSEAVAAIYTAKGRPKFNPLIVHVHSVEMAERYVTIPEAARPLIARYWPGPLTLVLPLRPDAGISDLVTAELDTLAIRMPAHPVARKLLQEYDGPLAAPSANPSGRISPTTAAHVMDGLSGRIAAVLEGGACGVGVESTILSLDPLALLRPGGLALEEIEATLGRALPTGGNADKPNAPGQLKSHYAPGAAVRLNATDRQSGEIWIGFGSHCAGADFNLSEAGDTTEAATRLFGLLREADALAQQKGASCIAVAPVPDTGLGLAVNDRLDRAAAPRP